MGPRKACPTSSIPAQPRESDERGEEHPASLSERDGVRREVGPVCKVSRALHYGRPLLVGLGQTQHLEQKGRELVDICFHEPNDAVLAVDRQPSINERRLRIFDPLRVRKECHRGRALAALVEEDRRLDAGKRAPCCDRVFWFRFRQSRSPFKNSQSHPDKTG